ncbi:MAG: S9 family peptidase [Deferribacteres bacterium]|nr:S9 family peptidase [candidate division KSB1 bacterium]MCB9502564.1 S9 family peptidase [Deferribacteres bacterium]
MIHNTRSNYTKLYIGNILLLLSGLFFISQSTVAQNVLTPSQMLMLKQVASANISPDGNYIAYTVAVPRSAEDKPGSRFGELWVYDIKGEKSTPFITGDVSIRNIAWKPDGTSISFITRRDDNRFSQVYLISLFGGEARAVTDFDYSVLDYQWHPNGKKLGFIATEPKTKREQVLDKKGYDFVFYEENLKHRNLYLFDCKTKEVEQLTNDRTVWSFEFSPSGDKIAFAASEKNLIDQRYAFQKIYAMNLPSKEISTLDTDSRKFGNYCFSADEKNLAIAAALNKNDHAISQAFVISLADASKKNLTDPNFRGHVHWVKWKDNKTLYVQSEEGPEVTLSTQTIDGKTPKLVLHSHDLGAVFSTPSMTNDEKKWAFTAESSTFPNELYLWEKGKKPVQLTNHNPQLQNINLGKQENIRYQSRDGWDVEGLLIYPVNYENGKRYPLVVIVHGGPESRNPNGWLTNYSRPTQILAGKGYAVFFPNYRSSTGYGLKYAAVGFGDAAGKEFDDIADGIDYLIEQGIADGDRVGLGGGSYGGYASAWFSSYYTKYVKAVCMFVGISDLISKRGTTDIPYEELYVHSSKKLEDMWQQSLERSPIYYAHQSKTATLIYGGTVDPRVHPSQSLEFYRRLKMNDHPAVRLVQYPGEQHGNRMQTGQIDVLYRIIDWYDWFVKDANPLDGPMPPLDISEKYGISLPAK